MQRNVGGHSGCSSTGTCVHDKGDRFRHSLGHAALHNLDLARTRHPFPVSCRLELLDAISREYERCANRGPNATLSAMSLNFGSQGVNTTSPAQSIVLSNYGKATLNITGITASANFAETDNCGTSLASAASCTISVTFSPSATGAITGTLSITDNASRSPHVCCSQRHRGN